MRFSPLTTALLIIVLVTASFSPSIVRGETKTAAQSDLGTALKFVRGRNLNKNLAQLIMRTALETPTIQNLASMHGGTPVFNALKEGTVVAVEKYDATWTENLAKSYAAHFTNEELASLLADKEESPYSEKFEQKKADVGNSMRDLSITLLGEATSDTVTLVLESFKKN